MHMEKFNCILPLHISSVLELYLKGQTVWSTYCWNCAHSPLNQLSKTAAENTSRLRSISYLKYLSFPLPFSGTPQDLHRGVKWKSNKERRDLTAWGNSQFESGRWNITLSAYDLISIYKFILKYNYLCKTIWSTS